MAHPAAGGRRVGRSATRCSSKTVRERGGVKQRGRAVVASSRSVYEWCLNRILSPSDPPVAARRMGHPLTVPRNHQRFGGNPGQSADFRQNIFRHKSLKNLQFVLRLSSN